MTVCLLSVGIPYVRGRFVLNRPALPVGRRYTHARVGGLGVYLEGVAQRLVSPTRTREVWGASVAGTGGVRAVELAGRAWV